MVERLLPIHKITDLTLRANAVELAMIKVMGKGTAIATNGRSAPRRRALCSSLPAAGQMRL
ncbi:MAG: hypothetical protein CR217_10880 [Beijerinckiaceae bacterium]|nr:MAG: hypothetical protein CR217_10880 [Beijerinckiaceae bacterium]